MKPRYIVRVGNDEWVKRGKLGRPSIRRQVFEILYRREWRIRRDPNPKPVTQGQLVRDVHDYMDWRKKDGLRKHITAFLRLKRNGKLIPDLHLPELDRQWFEKYHP